MAGCELTAVGEDASFRTARCRECVCSGKIFNEVQVLDRSTGIGNIGQNWKENHHVIRITALLIGVLRKSMGCGTCTD